MSSHNNGAPSGPQPKSAITAANLTSQNFEEFKARLESLFTEADEEMMIKKDYASAVSIFSHRPSQEIQTISFPLLTTLILETNLRTNPGYRSGEPGRSEQHSDLHQEPVRALRS